MFLSFLMVEKTFLLLQVKGNVINLYVRVASHELPNDLKLKILGN